MNETSVERIQSEEYCTVFTAERKFINQLKEFSTKYPEQVDIIKENEDGSILAHAPSNWFRFIKPPTKKNYTEEQRKAMGERMKKARENKKNDIK